MIIRHLNILSLTRIILKTKNQKKNLRKAWILFPCTLFDHQTYFITHKNYFKNYKQPPPKKNGALGEKNSYLPSHSLRMIKCVSWVNYFLSSLKYLIWSDSSMLLPVLTTLTVQSIYNSIFVFPCVFVCLTYSLSNCFQATKKKLMLTCFFFLFCFFGGGVVKSEFFMPKLNLFTLEVYLIPIQQKCHHLLQSRVSLFVIDSDSTSLNPTPSNPSPGTTYRLLFTCKLSLPWATSLDLLPIPALCPLGHSRTPGECDIACWCALEHPVHWLSW